MDCIKSWRSCSCSKTIYGCTFALLNHGITRYGVEVNFRRCIKLRKVRNAMKENTKVVYLETPANPTKINRYRSYM